MHTQGYPPSTQQYLNLPCLLTPRQQEYSLLYRAFSYGNTLTPRQQGYPQVGEQFLRRRGANPHAQGYPECPGSLRPTPQDSPQHMQGYPRNTVDPHRLALNSPAPAGILSSLRAPTDRPDC